MVHQMAPFSMIVNDP